MITVILLTQEPFTFARCLTKLNINVLLKYMLLKNMCCICSRFSDTEKCKSRSYVQKGWAPLQ